jgi:hypothetical protein
LLNNKNVKEKIPHLITADMVDSDIVAQYLLKNKKMKKITKPYFCVQLDQKDIFATVRLTVKISFGSATHLKRYLLNRTSLNIRAFPHVKEETLHNKSFFVRSLKNFLMRKCPVIFLTVCTWPGTKSGCMMMDCISRITFFSGAGFKVSGMAS